MKFVSAAALLLLLSFSFSCKQSQKKEEAASSIETEIELKYSTTFQLFEAENYKRIVITKPWPEAEQELTYYLAKDKKFIPADAQYDAFVQLPIHDIVLTSTTHIPSLISLNQLDKWVGFPGLDYVSSPEARALIENRNVTELGQNEALNTEKLLELNPDVVIGFAVQGSNKSLNNIEKAGIPVLYNSDWLDEHPLGKAEWIKFFGMLTGTLADAEKEFNTIEKNYLELKSLAEKAKHVPTTLSGAMYKDVWYLPGGNSWQAQFLKDANANYRYADENENGSLSKSFEAVLNQAKNAEYWIAPAQFTSYTEMLESSPHYSKFDAFQNKKVFTMAKTKGETGGVLYYELAPNRPDLVLRDLVGILHPDLLEVETFSFFEPLNE
ncbi:ABC transporter substrate-binding protein [Psychroflexus planctonicus]|uniref:ABC transporter substrate-binding protein n=1 Tax=Psychroflexus planctonicus TaxID=1526575 RepID=A0ABQ1SM89_9FLAO|nr:ABC transporter substrate-binding protein [Psychroflexus planctonicus]GGE43634.1 ABC transporter substrate-binding protein [Psychroflexus planctonicus]